MLHKKRRYYLARPQNDILKAMGKALYRKYRSRSLNEIIGQDHITSILERAIATDAVSHAYLLTGPRGVGKTSIARIIAHEINKIPYDEESTHLDIIEIDAASNNGVEDIRDLREKVHIAPVNAAKKVYIIDEVHMLSKQAFNALLKTLEEPPAHVVFILATTDVDKLPATIISRVQRFNFRSIPLTQAVSHLRTIADKESISITDEALERIAIHGQGSFRDSIVLLDQLQHVKAGDTISLADVDMTLGSVNSATIDTIVASCHSQNLSEVVGKLTQLEHDGAHARHVLEELIRAFSRSVAEHPNDIGVLARLSEVNPSQFGFIKLLVALTSDFNRHTPATTTTQTPVVTPSKPASAVKPAPTTKPTKKEVEPPAPTAPSVPIESKPFEWNSYLEMIKHGNMPLHSLIEKTQYDFDGKTLFIYAGNKFKANKLSMAKNTTELNKYLTASGVDADIEVLSTQKPSDNATVSAVTDIMGGGEEVSLNGA